jgi:hypothetical protein
LHNFKALQPEAVDWLNRDDLRVSVDEQSLDLNPFLLLICEVVRSLSLLDLFIELVDDNRDEQVHNEESGEENEDDKDDRDPFFGMLLRNKVHVNTIDGSVHHSRPHFQS